MMSDVDPPDLAVFGWGMTSHGQLGVGGVEDEQLVLPTPIAFWDSSKKPVKNIACGVKHTLFEADGVWSCGNNDYGQLGHDKCTKKPAEIGMLKELSFSQLDCGLSHSLALTDTGQLFIWGSNDRGQLGQGETTEAYSSPKIVKMLSPHVVIQVACGYKHCLALTNYGELYSWGDNTHGQLGVGTSDMTLTPQEVTCLHGLTVYQIAAGGHHSFMLTGSGSLFGWGKNNFGQLGLGVDNKSDNCFPTLVKSLKSQGVRYVSCGEDHTAVITQDGGVFTFGAGMYGQLGHNSKKSELLPRKVFELMGSVVTQITCGRCHTLACVGDSGRVYSFGLGANGQLGVGTIEVTREGPSVVKGLFVQSSGNEDRPASYGVHQIFSGGDHCFIIGLLSKSSQSRRYPLDMRENIPNCEPAVTIDEERMRLYCSITAQATPSAELIEDLEKTFSSLSCHNSSFLAQGLDHYNCSAAHSGVDIEKAMDYYARLSKLPNTHITEKVIRCIETNILKSLSPSPPGVEALRIYLTLPCLPAFEQAQNFKYLICPFAKAVINLETMPSKIVGIWWSQLTADHFIRLINVYRTAIVYMLCLPPVTTVSEAAIRQSNIVYCLGVLKKLHQVNENRHPSVPVESFYINELLDKIDVKTDYVRWIQSQDHPLSQAHPHVNPEEVTICHYPFVLNAQAKTVILHTEALLQMQIAVGEVNRRNMSTMLFPTIDPINPCLILYINRNNIVQDTISQIQKAMDGDLKKPLKIMFIGEEALDAGGVKKEFFLLILKEIMDPKYGMFKNYEESRLLWFQQQTFEEDNVMFMLIGVLCGLAIYNATIIDLKFPLALYKKILSKNITLEDLQQLDPAVSRSLHQLLEYEGDKFEETFGLNFEITQEVFGEVINVPLVRNAKTITVTKENRQEYVDTYLDYVFNTSITSQFKSFSEGFNKVIGGRVLKLFHAQELQAMVVGNENYDWEEFQKYTEYKAPFCPVHQTIKLFWAVFRELEEDKKKQFLLFLTGSDRIPISGMKGVKMIIQPTCGGDEFLPVAHTCFNLLDLPKYNSQDVMKNKLLQAIEHAQGFALV